MVIEMQDKIPEDMEPLESCAMCGGALLDGDLAYGVMAGAVNKEFDGFVGEFNPQKTWEYIFCDDCYMKKFGELMDRIEEVVLYLRLSENKKGGE